MFFDVDGILTDGSLVYEAEGRYQKIQCFGWIRYKNLIHSGISVGLISSRDHPATRARAIELGINNYARQRG